MVLENVEVFAVGEELERDNTGDAKPALVITLLVSPDNAQKLILASTQGRIQLTPRNPADNLGHVLSEHPNPMERPFRNLQPPPFRKLMKT